MNLYEVSLGVGLMFVGLVVGFHREYDLRSWIGGGIFSIGLAYLIITGV